MEHLLDNPVYNALISGNKELSHGTETVKYFAKNVAPFVGLKEATQQNFNSLFEIVPSERTVALVSAKEISIPASWKVVAHMMVLQMVVEQPLQSETDDSGIIPLNSSNIDGMLALTKLTNPGPFTSNTIAFGNYKGIFSGHQLVAMTGHRLHVFHYQELSAVCTHPDHTGKGYAKQLLQNQIHELQSNSKIPFLHVKVENTRAVKVYEEVGFVTRQKMCIYIIRK